ncbi:MAG: LuxR C-terminal-related transcriptional regulator [Nocardioides sp.]
MRVALAHECELVTRGFADMLAPFAHRVVVVPPGADGHPVEEVDLLLFDSLAPSLTTAQRLEASRDTVGLLVTYTWNPRPDLVQLALAAGSRGCLSKNLPARDLVIALESIHRGRVVVDCGTRTTRGRLPAPASLLTPREAEVVSLITQGFDNFSIAREACLSINSVKTYIRTAYRKMGVTTRSQAVLWGVRNGFLTEFPDDGAADDRLTG